MTSSNGNIFRIIGPLWGESSGGFSPPPQRQETRSFIVFWSAPEQTVKQTLETPAIWDPIALIMTSL